MKRVNPLAIVLKNSQKSDILLFFVVFLISLPFLATSKIFGVALMGVFFILYMILIFRRNSHTVINEDRKKDIGDICQLLNAGSNAKTTDDTGSTESETIRFRTPKKLVNRTTSIQELKEHFPVITNPRVIQLLMLRLPPALEYSEGTEYIIEDLKRFQEYLSIEKVLVDRKEPEEKPVIEKPGSSEDYIPLDKLLKNKEAVRKRPKKKPEPKQERRKDGREKKKERKKIKQA